MEEVIVGVVGTLQFDVLEYRLKTNMQWTSSARACRISTCAGLRTRISTSKTLDITSDTKIIQDFRDRYLLLFTNSWNITWALEHNKGLELSEFGGAKFLVSSFVKSRRCQKTAPAFHLKSFFFLFLTGFQHADRCCREQCCAGSSSHHTSVRTPAGGIFGKQLIQSLSPPADRLRCSPAGALPPTSVFQTASASSIAVRLSLVIVPRASIAFTSSAAVSASVIGTSWPL